eukprot:gnl/Dysnectes_brevis/7008_a11363_287.p1 GENE.gnl/Dysnectes_brevis/7008_a11363_287~~gnl/Dysnectes_brevis/7008_a11363_287.p1  ORF type:complete len:407 (-),score=2.14 gnl/Dysnectes_brevis/7008_a11363_287:267-1487(-)
MARKKLTRSYKHKRLQRQTKSASIEPLSIDALESLQNPFNIASSELETVAININKHDRICMAVQLQEKVLHSFRHTKHQHDRIKGTQTTHTSTTKNLPSYPAYHESLVKSFRQLSLPIPISLQPSPLLKSLANGYQIQTQTDRDKTPANIYSKTLFRAIALSLSQRTADTASIRRARAIVHLLGDPTLKYCSLTSDHGVTVLHVPPQRFLSFPMMSMFRECSGVTNRPPFWLQRPEEFGTLPPRASDVRPSRSSIREAANEVIKLADKAFKSHDFSIPKPSVMASRMASSGCKELLVALAVSTGCGSSLLPPSMLPTETRLPPIGMELVRIDQAWGQRMQGWRDSLSRAYRRVGLTPPDNGLTSREGAASSACSASPGLMSMGLIRHVQLWQLCVICDRLMQKPVE